MLFRPQTNANIRIYTEPYDTVFMNYNKPIKYSTLAFEWLDLAPWGKVYTIQSIASNCVNTAPSIELVKYWCTNSQEQKAMFLSKWLKYLQIFNWASMIYYVVKIWVTPHPLNDFELKQWPWLQAVRAVCSLYSWQITVALSCSITTS